MAKAELDDSHQAGDSGLELAHRWETPDVALPREQLGELVGAPGCQRNLGLLAVHTLTKCPLRSRAGPVRPRYHVTAGISASLQLKVDDVSIRAVNRIVDLYGWRSIGTCT
jgi:hypothetical protein